MKLFIQTPHGFRHLGDLDEDGFFEPSVEFEEVNPHEVSIPMSDSEIHPDSLMELLGLLPIDNKTIH